MAVGMFMRWEGLTKEQYDAARALVPFTRETAPGGLFHAVAFDDKGIIVTDVWESAEDFQGYLTGQLAPAFAQLGFTGHPEVQLIPLHKLITPGFAKIQ